MLRRKAFTLLEITICVLLVALVLTIVYKVFTGTLGQLFKTSNKMTNLRAASLLLERLKSDIRCAVVRKSNDDEDPVSEDGKTLSFVTTSDRGTPKKVTYSFVGDELKRTFGSASERKISTAKVLDFKVEIEGNEVDREDATKNSKYIKITIKVDNEKNNSSRRGNSEKNYVELKAYMFPRFYKESFNNEEHYWYETQSNNE